MSLPVSDDVAGSSVAVVGGSIAGCAAAVALSRAGALVTVFERSAAGLSDRGAGITIAASVYDGLLEAGYVDPAMAMSRREELAWVTADGRHSDGRVVGRQPYPAIMASWTLLWRGLRERLPPGCYRAGTAIASVRPHAESVSLYPDDGPGMEFDAVVGADGARSTLRAAVAPGTTAVPGRYVIWRGDYPVERLPEPRPRRGDGFVAIGFDGGHAVFYQIPDIRPDRQRQNWAVYGPAPGGPASPGAGPVPRGRVGEDARSFLDALVVRHLPPDWAAVVLATRREELAVTPMLDTTVDRYVDGRMLLAGDAGAFARPHTGGGAVKAIQDAIALESACRGFPTWSAALTAFDAERTAAGNHLTALGRHLGRMRVEQSPDWASMTDASFEAWVHANTHGWRSAYDPT